MNTLSHDSEIIARGWLCESQGDPTTAGLRHAVMLLLEHAEAEIKRLRAELDRYKAAYATYMPVRTREAADAAGGDDE